MDKKGTTEGGTIRRKARLEKTDVLLGNGKAEVGWTMPLRIASKYSRVSVGGTAHVFLHCNQDDETVVKAMKLCKAIATKAVKAEYPKIKALCMELDDEICRDLGTGG